MVFLLIAPITSDCRSARFLSPRKIAYNVSQKSLSHSPVIVCAASSLPNSSLVLSGQKFSAAKADASLTGGLRGVLVPEGTSGIPLGSWELNGYQRQLLQTTWTRPHSWRFESLTSQVCGAVMETGQDRCRSINSVTAAKDRSSRAPIEALFVQITPSIVQIFCHYRLMDFLVRSHKSGL